MKLTEHELLHELLEENKRLLGILEDVEWVQPISNSSRSCSCCGNMQHWGHQKDCALALTLGTLHFEDEPDALTAAIRRL